MIIAPVDDVVDGVDGVDGVYDVSLFLSFLRARSNEEHF